MPKVFVILLSMIPINAFSQEIWVDTVQFGEYTVEFKFGGKRKSLTYDKSRTLMNSVGDTVAIHVPGKVAGINILESGFLLIGDDTVSVLGYEKSTLAKDVSTAILYSNRRCKSFAVCSPKGKLAFSKVRYGNIAGWFDYEQRSGIYGAGNECDLVATSSVSKHNFEGESK